MKERLRKRKATGAGDVQWSHKNDLVIDILGEDNPNIYSIAGGYETSTDADVTETCLWLCLR